MTARGYEVRPASAVSSFVGGDRAASGAPRVGDGHGLIGKGCSHLLGDPRKCGRCLAEAKQDASSGLLSCPRKLTLTLNSHEDPRPEPDLPALLAHLSTVFPMTGFALETRPSGAVQVKAATHAEARRLGHELNRVVPAHVVVYYTWTERPAAY